MKPVVNPTFAIKTLLSKFTEIVYISDKEMELLESYILSENPVAESLADKSEIYETVLFLRDVAQECNYYSIEELLSYFDETGNDLISLLEPFIFDKSKDPAALNPRMSAHITCKANTVTMTSSSFCMDSIVSHKEHLQDKSADTCNDFILNRLEYSYKELNLLTHCWKRLIFSGSHSSGYNKSILPNGDSYYFRNYIKGLCIPHSQYPSLVFFVKRMKGWISLFLNDYAAFKVMLLKGRKKQNKIKSFYREVFDIIQSETQIENESFKTLLSRLMLTSKMNNPGFRQSIKTRNGGYNKESGRANFAHSDFIWKKILYKTFSKKSWAIMKSPEGHSWITSNNPGVSIDCNSFSSKNEQIVADPNWNEVDNESMIYFPLSRQYCLRLQPLAFHQASESNGKNSSVSFEVSTEDEVNFVNNLVVSTKPEVIISENKGIQLHCGEHCL